MTEQQKQVLTSIAGFMLSAAYKIDNTENEKEKKAGVALILDSVFENFDTEASNFMDELRKNLNGEN